MTCSFAHSQNIVTKAGNGLNVYDGDGVATAKQIAPIAIAVDSDGTFYITDGQPNFRIRKVTISGIISTIAGTGEVGYSGEGGPAINAKLSGVCGIFKNASNIYFTEWGNNTIRKINEAGIITTIAGIQGPAGYNGDGIQATAAKLASPSGIVADKTGNIYFSDLGNHCIRKINAAGIISTVAGTPTISGYSGDGNMATLAKLFYPGFLSIGPEGNLFWPEWPNTIVRKLDISTGIISTVAGNGVGGNSGDGGPATAAGLSHPNGVAIDTAGNIYIADYGNHNIRKVNTVGVISTIAGIGTAGYSGDNGPATAAELNQPNCVSLDKWGNVYINDITNRRIRRINYNTSAITDEVKSPANVNIHPNPASNEITITTEVVMKDLTLVNAHGQIVLQRRDVLKGTTLNVADLPAGIYIVKVNGAYSGKFVKE